MQILSNSELQKKTVKSTSTPARSLSKSRTATRKTQRPSRDSMYSSKTSSNQTSGNSEVQKRRQKQSKHKHQKSSDEDRKPKNTRDKDWKEVKEEEAFNDDAVARVGSHVMVSKVQPEPPKKVPLKTGKIDDDKVKKLLSRIQENKKNTRISQTPLDPKAKLLMDRMYKKPYPQKYKAKDKGLMLYDEASSFYRPSGVTKKLSGSVIIPEDSYSHYPNLANIRKLPEQNIYLPIGVPFWADPIEPDEADLVDCFSVGCEDVEMYHERKIVLQSTQEARVLLDVWQPFNALAKHDDVHFTKDLLFSNTLRSLLNVGTRADEPVETNVVSASTTSAKVRFVAGPPSLYAYSRLDPIASAREARNVNGAAPCTNATTTTTTTTTTSGE